MKAAKSRGFVKALVMVLILCAVTLKAYSWYCWERARRLSIIYSSDLLAEFDPCDCTEGKLGGLARRASFVAGVREEGVPTLLLDAGGIFFQSTDLPQHMRRQLSLKADSIARAYDEMGYDVVNVGDTDLALGLGRLLQLREGSDFSVLSSNLSPSREEDSVLPPFVIRKVGRLEVGIFGLMGAEGLAGSLEARDPVETARKLVERLRGDVDVLIALTYQGLSKDIELAREVEGIDIIIGGRTGASLAEPRIENGTIILQTGLKGGFIGRLDLVLYNDKEPWEDATESEKYRRLALEYAEVVAKNDAILKSSEDPGDRYGAQRMIDRYTKEEELARGRVKDFFGVNHFSNRVIPLRKDLEDDEGILEIIRSYKLGVRRLAGEEVSAVKGQEGLYRGAASCKSCHQAEYDSWMTTEHAHAYATLEATDQELDLECVGCHTTGYRKEGGFEAPAAVGNLKDVQCEVCHGPGVGHPGERAKLPLLVEKGVCLDCHTKEFNKEFRFEEFWARIAHTRENGVHQGAAGK